MARCTILRTDLGKNWRWLAYLFAGFGVLTVFGTGNATQVNTITTAIDSALLNYHVIINEDTVPVNVTGLLVLRLRFWLRLILLRRREDGLDSVTEALGAIYGSVLYCACYLALLSFHFQNIPAVFASIFEGAFHPSAVTGGVIGSFFLSMKKGVSRGIFSNEAGLGTGSIAHACADTQEACQSRGCFGIFEVFRRHYRDLYTDSTGYPVQRCVRSRMDEAAGAELTIAGFTATYGNWVSIFTAVAMCCFAFSTTLGWGSVRGQMY